MRSISPARCWPRAVSACSCWESEAPRITSAPALVAIELVAAVLIGSVLIRRQADHPAPMLPIDLFRRPLFALSTATAICSFAVQGLAFVSLPFYFEDILGRTQVETGFFMTPWPLVVAMMAPIAGRLSDRYAAGILGSLGLALLGLGMALLAMLPANPHVADIVWRMALCGCGFGFFQAPNMKAIMSSAPADRSGGASGIVATARLIGQTSGAALAALCFGLVGREGATTALVLGAAFAVLGVRDEHAAAGGRDEIAVESFSRGVSVLPSFRTPGFACDTPAEHWVYRHRPACPGVASS